MPSSDQGMPYSEDSTTSSKLNNRTSQPDTTQETCLLTVCLLRHYQTQYEYEYLYFGNIYDMAMKRKFIIYAPGNRNYGYCRLYFGYQIMIYIYIYTYITSMIETSRLMLIKIK